MKTRIKVVEYNNGKKEFICEAMGVNWKVITNLFCSFLGAIPALILLLIAPFTWETMKQPFNVDIDNPRDELRDAIFSHIEDAKSFIDKVLKEEADKKNMEHQLSVKKTYKIKHP
jgi:hypothetical protein